jgi:hypothetical protein
VPSCSMAGHSRKCMSLPPRCAPPVIYCGAGCLWPPHEPRCEPRAKIPRPYTLLAMGTQSAYKAPVAGLLSAVPIPPCKKVSQSIWHPVPTTMRCRTTSHSPSSTPPGPLPPSPGLGTSLRRMLHDASHAIPRCPRGQEVVS